MENRQDALNNARLLAAVARMEGEQSRESREAVLDAVILSAQFLAPVIIEDAQLGQDTAIQFQLIANQEGQAFLPAFTSWEELRKLCGPKNQQTVVLTFDQYAGMILRDNRAAGFVVDPFGACLSFDRAMVEHLVARKQELLRKD